MSSEKLKNIGLKITTPRLKIFKIFEEERDNHISAYNIEDLLKKQGEEIALATIYRVLGQFEESGLIVRHEFDEGRSLYELTDEGHHDHMVCNKCGKVSEFFDESIAKKQEKIAKNNGFILKSYCLILHGICNECQ